MADELNPIETVQPGNRYAQIMGMLFGNKVKIAGWTPGAGVFILDGKVYHVSGSGIDIWNYSEFRDALRNEAVPNYIDED